MSLALVCFANLRSEGTGGIGKRQLQLNRFRSKSQIYDKRGLFNTATQNSEEEIDEFENEAERTNKEREKKNGTKDVGGNN